MGRTTVEQSTNSYIVTNRLVHPEVLNERELKSLAGKLLETLIPVNTETTKKGIILKSAIVDMIPLGAYFSGIVTKKMFLDVVMQLIDIVQDCKKSFMNENNLMLDFDYIFLHPRTKKLKCIFWPIVNNQNQHITSEFFKELPFRVVFTKHEDHGYVSNYLQFFNNHTPFSINGFEKLIFEMTGKTVEDKSYLPTDSVRLETSKNPSNKLAGEKGNSGNMAYNPFGQQNRATGSNQAQLRACANCGCANKEDANFCVSCGASLKAEPVGTKVVPDFQTQEGTETQTFSETTVLGADNFDNGTTVLGADSLEEPSYPYLIREKNQEKISVDKPSFRIGKERRYCDYFIGDNNAVSRSHADILTKAGRYYIVDNNSTNKTYVEGRTVPVQKEVEIFSGTKLRLANEDFVFYI
ncbi:FHA domain-containing protein [Bacillus sp. DNRA2]|uniref:FHA domain-containing protein n=1 Tax=Bacillus sp. DNRA2 TaxID=2723053 RepID=UPI00145D48CF|nr:FHA domain-containing protein [Bacillus sp. DNRA2]NMD68687.1 FHA domain-containing protein [Bacillus sp. DNRA2]